MSHFLNIRNELVKFNKPLLLFLVFFNLNFKNLVAQKIPYLIYTKNLKKTSYKQLLKDAEGVDVIFFGEQHNNPIIHWLEYELISDLAEYAQPVIGMEMFETDEQVNLNGFLSGKTDEETFEKSTRLWNNYKTDYKPILLKAKEKNLPIIATNVPRIYARIVSKGGQQALDTLSEEVKKLMTPLPYEVDTTSEGYEAMQKMASESVHGISVENFIEAQALKDATMAYMILQNLEKGKPFIHINGAFHSDRKEGIVHYLKKYKPKIKILIVSSIEEKNVLSPSKQHRGKGDYIICITETMTKTY